MCVCGGGGGGEAQKDRVVWISEPIIPCHFSSHSIIATVFLSSARNKYTRSPNFPLQSNNHTLHNLYFPQSLWSQLKMARGNRSSLFLGLSALFYLVLLFAPLAFIQTVEAAEAQEPLKEDNYGVGKWPFLLCLRPNLQAQAAANHRPQLLVLISEPPTPVSVWCRMAKLKFS